MSRDGHADFCNKDHQPGITPCARIVSPPTPRDEVPAGTEVNTRSGTFPSVTYVKQEDGTWKPKYMIVGDFR